jgi:hypothetical protein
MTKLVGLSVYNNLQHVLRLLILLFSNVGLPVWPDFGRISQQILGLQIVHEFQLRVANSPETKLLKKQLF